MNILKNNNENAWILTKIKTREHNNSQNVNICTRNLDTNKEIESKRTFLKGKCIERILGPVHDTEKENWRILTNKEIYAIVKNLL